MKLSENARLTSNVKKVVLDSGASVVGIVRAEELDRFSAIWVGWKIQEYTKKTFEVLPSAKSLVVIGYHVWDDVLESAVRKGERWVYPGYFPLAALEEATIRYLVSQGYKAVSAHSLSYKRLAQLAGFGNFGKNSLVINPIFGPWLRFAAVLTDAKLVANEPFDEDLCGDCIECVKACPVTALTAYKVDDQTCLVGVHLKDEKLFAQHKDWAKYEPSITKNSHLMCMRCQKACPYGKERH